MMQNWWDQDKPAQTVTGPVYGAPAKVDPYAAKDDARKDTATSFDAQRLDIDQRKFALDEAKAIAEADEKAKKLADEDAKLSGAKSATASKLRRIIAQIGTIEKDAQDNGGWFETGASGKMSRAILGDGFAGGDLAGSLKTIDAENAFAALQALGEQGVKLTPISNAEIKLAAESVANLDPNQGHETFLKSIAVARSKYADLLSRVSEGELRDLGFNLPQYVPEETRNQYPEAALFYYGDGANVIGYDKADGEHVSLAPKGDGPSAPTGGGSGGGGGGDLGTAFAAGVGDIVEGAGDLVGLVSNPLNAGINAIAGTNLSTDLGESARSATGLPRGNPVAEAINKGGIGALAPAGLANALARGGTNMGRSVVTNALAQQPIQQGVGGAGAGLAAEAVNQAGGGPVLQTGAAMLGGLGSFTGANALAQRGAKAVAPIATGNALVDDAAQAKIPLMTSDARQPQTVIGKSARKVGELIPILGTSGPRVKQQQARKDAIKLIAEEFDVPNSALEDISADLTETRGKQIKLFSGQKTKIVETLTAPVIAPRAIAALDQKIADFSKVRTKAAESLVKKLQDFKGALQGKARDVSTGIIDPTTGKEITRRVEEGQNTLKEIEAIRKEMGTAFDNPSLADIAVEGKKAIRAIYDPLKADTAAFIKAAGGDEMAKTWRVANARLSGMADELQSTALKASLNKAASTPEDVSKLLFSTKPSQVRLLYNSLSSEGRAKAQGVLIGKAFEKGARGENPDLFVNELKKVSKDAGIFFQDSDLARVDGLSRVLDATRRAQTASVQPETGAQLVPYAIPAVFTQFFGLTGGISVAAGAGLLARLYESPAVRNSLLKVGRTKPGTPQEQNAIKGVFSSIAAANDNAGIKEFVANAPSSPAAAAAQTDDVND